jgi:UDP-N-acetylmuramate dehydrogenase
MQAALKELHERGERFLVVGKGSNLLFDDRGFNGAILCNRITDLEWKGKLIRVGGGYSFALLGKKTALRGYRGLEFASGIPGSVGGAVYMNAGADRFETKDTLTSVVFVNERGEIEKFDKKELSFSYRKSSFQERKGAIVEASFLLEEDKSALLLQKMLMDKRVKSQPLKEKSCGCVFRNPEGNAAGRLIQELGLKEKAIGDAVISSVHANFIVNRGQALAEDIKALITLIQKEVREEFGYALEVEVQMVPFEE